MSGGEVLKQQRQWDTLCFMCTQFVPKGTTVLRIRWLAANGIGLFGYFHENCGQQLIKTLDIQSTVPPKPRKAKP